MLCVKDKYPILSLSLSLSLCFCVCLFCKLLESTQAKHCDLQVFVYSFGEFSAFASAGMADVVCVNAIIPCLEKQLVVCV
jgi:hypothetical protein